MNDEKYKLWADKGLLHLAGLQPMLQSSSVYFILSEACPMLKSSYKAEDCRQTKSLHLVGGVADVETDIQEKDKNKAKNDKTEHENEKSVKKQSKSKSQSQSQPRQSQSQLREAESEKYKLEGP
ncbi:hypothetical protein Tco_0776548 [Tanacetum coccineum]